MAALQCGAALVVMALYLFFPGLRLTGEPKASIGLLLVFGPLMLLLAALPPYIAAVATWWLSTAFGRGPVREVVAVMTGAVVGSLVPLFLLRSALWPEPGMIFTLWVSIAVCSALGFAAWVSSAWVPGAAQDSVTSSPTHLPPPEATAAEREE